MKHIQIKDGRLTFTDGRFYQHPSGEWVPSVTTVLEAYPKPYALLQWMKEMGSKSDEVIRAAGERGTSVHEMTEAYDRGEAVELIGPNGKPNCTLDEWGMFERYVDFCKRYEPKWEMIERAFVGNFYAGTVDRVGILNDGRRYLIDLKTSNGVYDTYWLQLAAYWNLYRETEANLAMELDGVAILWLNAKTRTERPGQGIGWQFQSETDASVISEKLELFHSVQAIWEQSAEKKVPKVVSYQLRHVKE